MVVLEDEGDAELVVQLDRLLEQDALSKHDFAVWAAEMRVCANYCAVGCVVRQGREHLRLHPVQRHDEAAEVPGVAEVEAGSTLAAAVRGDIAD